MANKTYTTSEIAEICDVYPSTVINWISGGRLKAYSTPGRHNRVTRDDLIVFLKEMRVPIPEGLRDQKKVLIAEDDPQFSIVLQSAFAEKGWKAEVRDNGVEALISIGREAPDLVVLDLVLPKMDGFEVCEILKAKPETRAIKIIAVTGQHVSPEQKAALLKRVDGFFAKPLDVHALVARAEQAVNAEGVVS